MMHYKE